MLVDWNDLAAMLAAKRSAVITSKVNLRIPLHIGDEACKNGIHFDFETQGRCHQKSKIGVSIAPQKGLISSIFLKEKVSSIICAQSGISTKCQREQMRSLRCC